MVVLSQVVVVELNQGLDGLLHCGHLDQGHLAVFSRKNKQIVKPLHFFGAKLTSFRAQVATNTVSQSQTMEKNTLNQIRVLSFETY